MNFEITTSPDKEKWNNFVDNNKYSDIFQRFEMADIYNNTRNMRGLKFAVTKEDKIIACMAIKIESRWNFLTSLTSVATIENAPLYEDSEQGREAAKFLIEHYNQHIKRKVLYTNIKVKNNHFLADLYKLNGYEHIIGLNYEINLNKTSNEIFRSIHKSKRQDIERAIRRGVTVVELEKNPIPELYKILKESYNNLNLPLPHISYFNAVSDLMPNNIKVSFVKYQNMFIAGGIVLIYKNRIFDWYVGANTKYLKVFPNDVIVWNSIKWGCNNGYTIFDHGGAGILGKEYGIREFKRKFGGELIEYDIFTKVHRPVLLWFMKKGYKVYNSLLRK
tara:strand:- start:2536 stop:3534 length:999 start_codon:yes stop_codon:yes gene_type:complete